jgi:hypothetical protein
LGQAAAAVAIQHDLNELFRTGRRSLAIGIPILVACFLAARFAAGYLVEPVQRLVEESFLILGSVANWRPLEIFLYDWWPVGGGAICTAVWRRPPWSSGHAREAALQAPSSATRSSRDIPGQISGIRIRYIMEHIYLQLDQTFSRIF